MTAYKKHAEVLGRKGQKELTEEIKVFFGSAALKTELSFLPGGEPGSNYCTKKVS